MGCGSMSRVKVGVQVLVLDDLFFSLGGAGWRTKQRHAVVEHGVSGFPSLDPWNSLAELLS